MHLKKIHISQFRNYEMEHADLAEGLNLIVGLNGMGKTNLLDAIYTLCLGKSAFSVTDTDMVKTEGDFFRVEGVFFKNEKHEKIVVKFSLPKKKELERNGTPYKKISEHVGFLPVVMIAPDDIRIVKEGSEHRRRLVDITLSQVNGEYLRFLSIYQKLLDQRNALLKNDQFSLAVKMSLLDAIDNQMIAPAEYIFKARSNFMLAFQPVFHRYYQLIAAAKETVSCIYESPLQEAAMAEILQKNRQQDIHSGRTASGIHRDDLVLAVNGSSLKKYGSQGQIKSFVMALKFSQFDFIRQQTGEAPILLLDDIFDKLDEKRVLNILKMVNNAPFGQVIITDTHTDRLSNLAGNVSFSYSKLIIDDGKIT